MLNSPNDNIPALEGDIYCLTVQLDHEIENEGEMVDELKFSTIQSSKEDAYKRLVYVAETEWQVGVDHVIDCEQFDGSRQEQLANLLDRYEETGVHAPETIVDEFVQTMETIPEPMRADYLRSMPDVLKEQLGPHLPSHFQRYL